MLLFPRIASLFSILGLVGATASMSLGLQHQKGSDRTTTQKDASPPLGKKKQYTSDKLYEFTTTEFLESQVEKTNALLPHIDNASRQQERLRNHRKLKMASDKSRGINNQYIFTFKPGADLSNILLAVVAHNLQMREGIAADTEEIFVQKKLKYSFDDVAIFKDLPEDDLLMLLDHPQVMFAEQDQILELNYRQNWAPWHLDKIDEPSSQLNSVYEYKLQGFGVDVYIVDSGIQIHHGDFEGRARCGFNAFADTEQGCKDVQMHGTHVASIVGGATYGVAKNVELISVKVVNANNGDAGSVGTAIRGLDYVIQQKRAHPDRPAVANVSLGSGASIAFNEAIDRTVAAGVLVVVAAGNDSVDACTRSPSSATNSITVGSIGQSNYKSAFSNFGPCVDIFAPGEEVTAASPAWSGTSTLSGTSMASPVVAGVAALYLEREPGLTPDDVWRKINHDASEGLVQGKSDTSPDLIVSVDNLNRLKDQSDSAGECKELFSSCSLDDECCWSCNSWFIYYHFCFFV